MSMMALLLLLLATAHGTEAEEASSCSDATREDFERDGYVVLRNLLTAEEVDAIEAMFDSLTHPGTKELREAMGRDYGDQSQGHGVDPSQYQLINVNNPARYLEHWRPNPFIEKISAASNVLLGGVPVQLDYEQLLEKRPKQQRAVFPWHQDMQYWPKRFPENATTRTATFSLALSDAGEVNGCLRVIPKSGVARQLLSGRSRTGDAASADHGAANSAIDETGDERAIVLPLTDDELRSVALLPVRRGDVTVHDEWIVHGSGGNPSDVVRKTYVAAFRDRAMVEYERSIGFTHSYNDSPETIRRIRADEL